METDQGTGPGTDVADLRWSGIAVADAEAWSALTNRLAEADGTDEFYSAEDLAEEVEEDGVDPERDLWAVWDGETMVAYGQLRVGQLPQPDGKVRCQLGGGVHPDHRGRGIGRALMDRMEARAAVLAAERHPGLPAYLRAPGGIEGASVRRMLEHRGYAILRYFNQMRRPLPGEPLSVEVPPGVRLVPPAEEHRHALREAHNEAFADHWGMSPFTEGRWDDVWTARSRRPALSCVALDDDGRILGYVMCSQWVDRELYVDLVGTVPAARGRGLARAALAHVVATAATRGEHDVVDLDVDSASPTGATRLYEGLGFALTKVFAAYGRDL